MNTSNIIEKLIKYSEDFSGLAEILDSCKESEIIKEFKLDSFKLVESGTGLEGLDRSVRAIIFEANGECLALTGTYDSWQGTIWNGISRASYKQVTVNQYSILD